MEEDMLLYKEFLNGNKEAFEELINKYRKNIILFVQGIVKNIDVAEDLSQDVFVYILINKREYDFKYSMKTYLYTIAKSRAYNYLKKEKRKVNIDESNIYIKELKYFEDIEEKLYLDERKKEIINAIKKLKNNQRIAIYLADIEGLSYKEISKVLGKKDSQTKMIIYRARKNLEKIIRKEVEK